MKAVWLGIVILAGVALAERHHRHIDDYGESEEAHLETIELPKQQSHRSELRQIVSAIKDVKSCLCKLINVQKKQMEMEISRRPVEGPAPNYDPIVGKPQEDGKKDIPQELPTPLIPESVNAPQGVFISTKSLNTEDNLEVAPTDQKEVVEPSSIDLTTTTTTTEQPSENSTDRSKRQAMKSDFVELPHHFFEDLQNRGFIFNSDEEAEKAFLGEHPAPVNKPSAVVVNQNQNPPGVERKAREAPLHPPLKPESEYKSDESMEGIEAEHLTVGYDVGQKNKERKAQITPLPRQKSIEFPAGSTYYGTGDDQKPVDYTLNIPQQTYYLVPGPAPGKNPMVTPVIGNYDPAFMNHHQQYPSHSLQAQYAPSSAEYDGHGAMTYQHEEEEEPVAAPAPNSSEVPPKEEKKKSSRKNKKSKKPKDPTTTTTPAFES